MEQTVEEREEREEREEAEAEALADLKCRPSETIERVERMAATLRDAPPLKKGQLLDSLATDPPLGVRAGVDSDSEMRRACGAGRTRCNPMNRRRAWTHKPTNGKP